MKLILVVAVICLMVNQFECTFSYNHRDLFEFGVNTGRVVFSKTDKIGLLEKNTQVPITVPPCVDIKYVRVEVDNKKGPPKVDFDINNSLLTIKYRRTQYSKSSFTVIAKGDLVEGCKEKEKQKPSAY